VTTSWSDDGCSGAPSRRLDSIDVSVNAGLGLCRLAARDDEDIGAFRFEHDEPAVMAIAEIV